ncbi:DNA-binding protein Alba [Candidatus Bathyarchaeota archaeon]|jgi:DNA-binding protein|nr:DNA-binding protein Alba [Candidatus Bathyarchaeota archaeon]
MSSENTVFIGRKPILNYCTAVLSVLRNSDTVIMKARGAAISTAVDVAEVTRSRFLSNLKVDSIEIGTEELTTEEGRLRNVSTIKIVMNNNK